ncbi:MAG TPA: PEP-CTERM sorting domain-containing protein [Tepidisphaeraceae bacterium]
MSKSARAFRGAWKTAAVALMAAPAAVMAAKPAPPPPPPPPTAPPPPPSAVKVSNSQFFSWFQTTTTAYPATPVIPAGSNTGTPTSTTTGTYVGTPFLSDANASAVNTYLSSLPAGAVRSVKVLSPISNGTAQMIFNNASYNVSYVFGDLEGANAAANAATLVKQVKYVNPSTAAGQNKSFNAFIGNFGFSAQGSNLQKPSSYAYTGQHSYSDYGYSAWKGAGLNMSNEEVYPGSPSFRSKAASDTPQGSGTYSNIRGQLFVLPLWRVGNVTDRVQTDGMTGHQNVPWTANFNNWGNLALDNDRDASNGYTFNPNAPMVAKTVNGKAYPAMTAAQTQNQMMSQRDFATMMTHMRLRGADSFHLLESGIVGVSNTQMEQDAATGWLGEASVNSIFAEADRKLLIGTENAYGYGGQSNYSGGSYVTVDGVNKNVDQAGAIFSGAYSLTLKKLDVLISNMDDGSHTITLPATIGGYALATKDFAVSGGDHKLVEFSLVKSGSTSKWQVAAQHVPFTAISNSRNGFGIPEPGTLSLLAVAGVFGLNRRKRIAQ